MLQSRDDMSKGDRDQKDLARDGRRLRMIRGPGYVRSMQTNWRRKKERVAQARRKRHAEEKLSIIKR